VLISFSKSTSFRSWIFGKRYQAEPLDQKIPSTLRARSLHTPNTPNYRWPPDLESSEVNHRISRTLSRIPNLLRLSSTRTPSISTPPLTPRPITSSRPNKFPSLRHVLRERGELTTTVSSCVQSERIQAPGFLRRLGSGSQEQPEQASGSSFQFSYGRNKIGI
jgi:hypothetical protein